MAHEPARVGMPRIVSGVVARPELRHRLDERARLMVVRGAPGTGKSTLVASWVADSELPRDVLWVARAENPSRRSYWASVIAELDRFGVVPAPRELTEASAGAEAVAAFAQLTHPMLLVLDNFGPPGSDWTQVGHDILAVLAAVPLLSVVVIGREPLELEASPAGADVVIAGDDLLLRRDEARRIAQRAGLVGTSRELLAELLAASGGAVYAFRFAVEAAIHPERTVAGDAIIARDLRERGDGTAAIPFALSGRDFDLAAELLVEHFVEFDPETMPQLTELMASIDRADLAAYPSLAVVTSLLVGPRLVDPEQAQAAFATAIAASRARRQPGTTARHRFTLAAGEAIAQCAIGRASQAAAAARDALAAARDMSHGERAAMGTAYPMLLGQSGQSALYALEPALAHACFNAELAASPRTSFGRRRNVALSHLAMLAVLGGRLRLAERLLGEVVDADWLLERPGAPVSAAYAVAAAYLAFNRGDIDAGRRVLDAHGGDRLPAAENWGFTAVARALACALEGDAARGRAELVAADAQRRRGGERLGAEVAGVSATIELLQLASPERVVLAAQELRLSGRSTVLLLTVRALRAALGGRIQTAVEYLGRAARFGTSPFQDLIHAIVGVTAARRGGTNARGAAECIGRIVVEHRLLWPLAILGAKERAAVLAELGDSDSLAAVRAAFDRVPATVGLTPEVIEFYPRELAVLRDLIETSSRAELAARSGVSINTVKTQLGSLYRKLEVGTREAALTRAAELGLLDGWASPPPD